MTFNDFLKLVEITENYYPGIKTIPSTDVGLELWFNELKDFDFNKTAKGLKNFVRTSTFPPKLCDFVDFAISADEKKYLPPEEAWGLVFKAICNSGYNSTEEFAKLPKECQEAVGSPWVLKEMAICGIDYVNKTEKYNFLSAYKQIVDKKKKLCRKTAATQANDKKLTENSEIGKLHALIDNMIEKNAARTAETEQKQSFLELPVSNNFDMPENAKKQMQDYSQNFFGQDYDMVVDMLNKKMQENLLQNLLKNFLED